MLPAGCSTINCSFGKSSLLCVADTRSTEDWERSDHLGQAACSQRTAFGGCHNSASSGQLRKASLQKGHPVIRCVGLPCALPSDPNADYQLCSTGTSATAASGCSMAIGNVHIGPSLSLIVTIKYFYGDRRNISW